MNTPGSDGGEQDEYQHLLDDARSEEAVRSRTAQRWLRQRAEESAEFLGVLLGLSEQHAVVTVTTVAGSDHRGRIVGVARDFVALRSARGPTSYVRLDAVAHLRPEPDVRHAAAAAARVERHDRTLAEQLAWLAADRPRVTLAATSDRRPVTGQLRAVGGDVATVRRDGQAGGIAYVRVPAVIVATILDA